MLSEKTWWPLEKIKTLPPELCQLWCTPSCSSTLQTILPFKLKKPFNNVSSQETVIVVGGGTFLDQVKAWRVEHATDARFVAIPSIWGSGAEVSPICVLNGSQSQKRIFMGEEYRFSQWSIIPELAKSLSVERARWACGDVWSHALEGFLSPLATDDLLFHFGTVITKMLKVGIGVNFKWFELSAEASSLQASCSVGLTHGIAHQIEGRLKSKHPGSDWGHAKLCSIFLWPVMCFNRTKSEKFEKLSKKFGIDSHEVFTIIRKLFDENLYDQALPYLQEFWKAGICRDTCSRTNSTLVSPRSLAYFENKEFLLL